MTWFSVHKGIIGLKRVGSVCARISLSHKILRGPWWDIIPLNMHVSTEEKRDDTEVGFYEELEHVLDHFLT